MWGAEHPDTLTSISGLALTLKMQGKYKAAETMNRKVLNGEEKMLGLEHPDTLLSLYCLARLFHTQQRYSDASVLYRRASEGYMNILGPDHPHTQACSRDYESMIDEMKGRYIQK